jgi:hypothetical protein
MAPKKMGCQFTRECSQQTAEISSYALRDSRDPRTKRTLAHGPRHLSFTNIVSDKPFKEVGGRQNVIKSASYVIRVKAVPA